MHPTAENEPTPLRARDQVRSSSAQSTSDRQPQHLSAGETQASGLTPSTPISATHGVHKPGSCCHVCSGRVFQASASLLAGEAGVAVAKPSTTLTTKERREIRKRLVAVPEPPPPLPPFHPKAPKLTPEAHEKSLMHLYYDHFEHHNEKLAKLEQKWYNREQTAKVISDEELQDSINHLYTATLQQSQRKRAELRQKYLSPLVSKSKLSGDTMKAMANRLADVRDHDREVSQRLDAQWNPPREPARKIGAGELADCVARLSTKK